MWLKHLAYALTTVDSTPLEVACPLAGPLLTTTTNDIAILHAEASTPYLSLPLTDRALAFDRTLQLLHQRYDLLPLRFGTLHPPDSLVEFIRGRREQIKGEMERLRGKTQLNVRWLGERPAPPARKSPDSLGGTEYMLGLLKSAQSESHVRQMLTDLCQHVQERHHLIAVVPSITPWRPSTTANRETRLVGLDCLVERSRCSVLRSVLQELQFCEHPSAHVSEPLPPFSFVSSLEA